MPIPDVNPSAVPSPAPAVQYDSWDDKGNPIVSKKDPAASNAAPPPQAQDSAPAPTPEKKATPEPKGESAAESGTAPKQEKKGKQTAEERIQELIADRKSLEERLRKLETSPQTTSKTEPAKLEPPKRPNPFKWTGTPEEYEQALDAWEGYQKDKAVADFQRQQFAEQSRQKNAEMMKQTVAKYPDAEAKIRQAATELVQKAPEFVGVFVNESDVLTDLLYALSDPVTLSNIVETAKTNPSKALRALRDMELDIQKEVKTEVPKAEAEPDKAPVEPKPRAPKPPSEVGGRGTSPEDALVAAARTNDFRAFEAEQNRRRLAAK